MFGSVLFLSSWFDFPDVLWVLAFFSLAWLVLGILAGRRMVLRRFDTDKPASTREAPREFSDELYVGNLPYEVTDRELKKTFQKFGKVMSARVIANKANGKSKGFGFVAMNTRAQCDAAIKTMHGKEFRGRKLVVNRAK